MRGQPAPPLATPVPTATLVLRYRGPVPMVLRGPRSGRLYELREGDSTVAVEPEDAEALLGTDWFTVPAAQAQPDQR